MGALRLYLALCVVAAHTGGLVPWELHDGRHAVEIFYIISGFYMALVLSSRYGRVQDFYLSRFLRIFPLYWIILVILVGFSVTTGIGAGRWQRLTAFVDAAHTTGGSVGSWVGAVLNTTLFGQDWAFFLTAEKGRGLHFTLSSFADVHPLWQYFLNPPSWTLALELTFYLFAPFLNRLSTAWLIVVAIASAGGHAFGVWRFGLTHDPWTYRFFPFELANFVYGMLAFRWYDSFGRAATIPKFVLQRWSFGFWLLVIPAVAVGELKIERLAGGANSEWPVLLSYPLWAAVVAIIFVYSRRDAQDRVIGELSYPVYLLHWTICIAIGAWLTARGLSRSWMGPLAAIGSIGGAAVLYRWIVKPLDAFRHRRMTDGSIATAK